MTKKTREIKTEEEEIPQEKFLKSRGECYSFPKEGITIRATSLKEAQKKLREIKK